MQLRSHPDRGARGTRPSGPVPLHYLSQEGRRTIHCEPDSTGRQRNGRGRDGESEGRNGCAAFVPVLGSALFGVPEGTGEIEIRLGTLHQAPTDLAPSYETHSRPVGLTKPWSRHRDSGVVTVNLLGGEDVLADRYARQGITSMLDAVCLGGPGGLAARSDRGDLRA